MRAARAQSRAPYTFRCGPIRWRTERAHIRFIGAAPCVAPMRSYAGSPVCTPAVPDLALDAPPVGRSITVNIAARARRVLRRISQLWHEATRSEEHTSELQSQF